MGEPDHQGLTVVCLPTQHWSARTLWDQNRRLWAGWAVLGRERRFYFAGDTGYYAPIFQEIGRRLGPFDLGAIPIGAYMPRAMMQFSHVTPEEALQVFEDIRRATPGGHPLGHLQPRRASRLPSPRSARRPRAGGSASIPSGSGSCITARPGAGEVGRAGGLGLSARRRLPPLRDDDHAAAVAHEAIDRPAERADDQRSPERRPEAPHLEARHDRRGEPEAERVQDEEEQAER